MKVTSNKRFCLSLAVSLFSVSAALGAFDLQITEMWPGNEPGLDLTEDWFEITNFGDMSWVAATDGDLWFDDDSFDPEAADLMSGVASIAPGESVIFVDGGEAGAIGWSDIWSPVVNPLPQVGSYNGSGLSGGGDAVGIWISATMPMPGTDPDFTASYPEADPNGGQSYDTVLQAFSVVGNASGAVATIAVNDAGQAAIGSPGAVPEPGSISILLAGLGAMFLNFRKRS